MKRNDIIQSIKEIEQKLQTIYDNESKYGFMTADEFIKVIKYVGMLSRLKMILDEKYISELEVLNYFMFINNTHNRSYVNKDYKNIINVHYQNPISLDMVQAYFIKHCKNIHRNGSNVVISYSDDNTDNTIESHDFVIYLNMETEFLIK